MQSKLDKAKQILRLLETSTEELHKCQMYLESENGEFVEVPPVSQIVKTDGKVHIFFGTMVFDDVTMFYGAKVYDHEGQLISCKTYGKLVMVEPGYRLRPHYECETNAY
jgi:hypothetical protein